MPYHVRTIENVSQIDCCELFRVEHFQWTNKYSPKTYGRMGLIDGYGIVVSMTAEEKDPLRTYIHRDDPVYMDSAMEVFLDFDSSQKMKRYFNFEMNSNGAMLSAFGDKKDRSYIKECSKYSACCEAEVKEESWDILLGIPAELISELFQIQPLQKGDRFTCNFYKICETAGFEHYASYAPIINAQPNFHLPEFFSEAIIC